MPSYDVSDAQEQKEFVNGPVPAGSIVWLKMLVVQPDEGWRDAQDNLVTRCKSGLKQLHCKFEVAKGSYQGVNFYQNITLPKGAQDIFLKESQEKSCNIGAATIKAICEATRVPTKFNSFAVFHEKIFPAKLKLQKNPIEDKNGNPYWKNEFSLVIVPSNPEFAELVRLGEKINPTGAVVGNIDNAAYAPSQSESNAVMDMSKQMYSRGSESYDDAVPF